MNTTIGLDGKTKTKITDADRVLLHKAWTMCRHAQANVPALQEVATYGATALETILKYFDDQEKQNNSAGAG